MSVPETPDSHNLPTEIMELQMGPSHPATHGTIKFNLKLEGEKVLDCDVEVGYLHRGFAKSCENVTWTQVIPYTDRLNYASPLINNVGYALAVEKLIGVETPPRCQYIRVIVSELSRIFDHLTCCGMCCSELGAITVGFYMIEAREMITRIIEALTGARLTVTYVRVGGVKHDLPLDFAERVERTFKIIRKLLDDCDGLLSRNRIFIDRMSNIGVISRETAISYSLTGPILRATGVSYDVRKTNPYLVYDQLDFTVPLGTKGDNYDRFVCRIQEIEQSMKIVEQALKNLPVGPVWIEDPRFVLPEKEKVYNSIEGLMHHFKIIMEGIKVPPGETYFAVEGGNGELGFYIVSDGA
jgi:NADH-quinone oxidoreductase subunit D